MPFLESSHFGYFCFPMTPGNKCKKHSNYLLEDFQHLIQTFDFVLEVFFESFVFFSGESEFEEEVCFDGDSFFLILSIADYEF